MCLFAFGNGVFALESSIKSVSNVLQGGVSLSDRVPVGFFGAWKVISVRSQTNNPSMFAPYSVDIWNFSKASNVITLSNPVSGARASISVNEVNGETVRFKKVSYDVNEESVETPLLTLEGDNFHGVDRIEVKTFDNGRLVKTEFVEYKVRAIKMSGATIPDLFGY